MGKVPELGRKYGGLSTAQTSQQTARMDMTAYMCAKFVEMATGNTEPLFESIQMLMKDPERMAGCLVTMGNLLAAYVSNNGNNLMRLKAFNDHLLSQIKDDSAVVGRLVQEHG